MDEGQALKSITMVVQVMVVFEKSIGLSTQVFWMSITFILYRLFLVDFDGVYVVDGVYA